MVIDQSRALNLGLKDFRQGPEAEMDKGSVYSCVEQTADNPSVSFLLFPL